MSSHRHKTRKPNNPILSAGSSFLCNDTKFRSATSCTTSCTLSRSSSVRQELADSRSHNSILLTHLHPHAAESCSLVHADDSITIAQNNFHTALPLMSDYSSSSTIDQAPFLHGLHWFARHPLQKVEARMTQPFLPDSSPSAPSTFAVSDLHPRADHNNKATGSSNTYRTLGLMSLIDQATESNMSVTCESNSSLISNFMGGSQAAQNAVSSSILQAHVVAHPLFEHLLGAHLACLRVGTPPEQWLADGIEAHIALSKQIFKAKYLLLAHDNPPHDKEYLDHFMLSFILLLQTFGEQIRQHMRLHSAEALSRCAEIKEEFLRLTGDLSSVNDLMACSSNTMSDDEGMIEDDENDAVIAYDPVDHQVIHDAMHMMMSSSDLTTSIHSDVDSPVDRPLMERVRKELRLELKQNYKRKLWDVREEIMRKRRAGKLTGSTISSLRHWWDTHSRWPYPTRHEEEKQRLMHETGLEINQINNWFINQRKRNWTINVPAMAEQGPAR